MYNGFVNIAKRGDPKLLVRPEAIVSIQQGKLATLVGIGAGGQITHHESKAKPEQIAERVALTLRRLEWQRLEIEAAFEATGEVYE
ncbi:MAG: hypothetical protein VB144_11745 [Clostridia bacterium]|nr:hypothetical protein [Clostridia bacterium]